MSFDHKYRFDDVIVSANAADLQAYLRDAYGGNDRPLCMCTPAGVPMYIARVGDHFSIKRMPNTGGAHSPECPSYEPPSELSGLGELKGQAIRENVEEGVTELRLDFALSKTGTRTTPEPSGVQGDTVRTDGAKLTLRGMLHYLWDEAGLNRWHPAMEGKRSWYVVRRALLHAASDKVSKRAPLHQNLYVPETFSSDRETEIAQRRIAHMADLVAPGKTRKMMIVIAEAKEIAASRYGFKIVAKHLPKFPFMMNEDLHRRLQKRFANELALWDSMEDTHLVFIGTFWLGPTGVATLEALSVMVTSSNWIPFEHAYDKIVLDALTSGHRRFVKGLRYNLADDKPLATAVLVDVDGPPAALYICPPGDDEEADEVLQELVESSEMPAWIWRAGDEMPSFPPPKRDAVRFATPAVPEEIANDEADSAW
ncbi:DUF1173 domain-containing protein [Burkholderia multivorans]|uniref:DUF1173 domain-containing protein n=1 Tax=Burkholderia multivorans TaxID=87883 RepID=UPI00075A74D0|nr:DUF1173 domain-containing protein [Burkholderia multivorans]KVS16158.1 hypothetical protein WK33_06395 [Burkholderia multivorans]MBU9651069.1 DUF1173 domain-containing protein [Burkholderia multivorans]MCO1451075.1 DUF1173 domain-containing protein [Burkholderia multivorans]MDN8103981.1 DUF1173 domain-containing protein [Burkholderia multivorans]PRG70410.1 DUF1173 domain-containing protein [Burkholderia multivorans]